MNEQELREKIHNLIFSTFADDIFQKVAMLIGDLNKRVFDELIKEGYENIRQSDVIFTNAVLHHLIKLAMVCVVEQITKEDADKIENGFDLWEKIEKEGCACPDKKHRHAH